MADQKSVLISSTFFLLLIHLGSSTRTSTKIYYDVDTSNTPMCFRRFNGTVQIGCSSDRNGNVGVVYVAMNSSSIEQLLASRIGMEVIIVTKMEFFSSWNTALLHHSAVRGVVILNINESDLYVPKEFSPDQKCPNQRKGDGDQCQVKWNPFGSNSMFFDYPFPIITLTNASVADFLIHECFEKYNTDMLTSWSAESHLCGMEIRDVMDGAKDTPTCMRRNDLHSSLTSPPHYCDPLKNDNIFASLQPMKQNETNSVVIIAARLDAFSMFDTLYPGFESAVLSYVTLFAVAEAIGKVKKNLENSDKHILFALFHGEAFDYIGSSRMIYDLGNGHWNFTVSDISMFIEIGQLGLHDNNTDVYIHSTNGEAKDFASTMIAAGQKFNVTMHSANMTSLPPSSLKTFQLNRSNISGIFISNHLDHFTNRYYNSMYDKPSHAGLSYPDDNSTDKYNYVGILASHIQSVASAVARSTYQHVSGLSEPDDLSSNSTVIANLLYCFAVNSSCELLNYSYTNSCARLLDKPSVVLPRYVGVGHGRSEDFCMKYLLANFLGDVVKENNTKEGCDKLSQSDDGYFYYFVRGEVTNTSDPSQPRAGQCVKSMANSSEAKSPAFLIDGYNWESGVYSTWSESSWSGSAMGVRIFLIPSRNQEVKTFVLGIMLLLLSFVVVYFIDRKATVLFKSSAV